MAAPRKYPEELRERATRLAVEARQNPASASGAIKWIADQLGVHPEALRMWVKQAETDEGVRPGRRRRRRSGSPSWNVRCVSCAGRTKS
jgi:transposase